MAMPDFTMRQLLEAGVHFGHHTRRWNPKMEPYLFGVRNGVHIIDLEQTVPLLDARAARRARRRRRRRPRAVRRHQARGRRARRRGGQALRPVLRQSPLARRHADQLEDHLGTIKRLREIDELLTGDTTGLTKKELLDLTRDRDKLERALGGIKEMGGLPDILFVIDTNKEAIAVQEANKLEHPGGRGARQQLRPGRHHLSDPGQRRRDPRHQLYCELVSGAVLDGLRPRSLATGATSGAAEEAAAPSRLPAVTAEQPPPSGRA